MCGLDPITKIATFDPITSSIAKAIPGDSPMGQMTRAAIAPSEGAKMAQNLGKSPSPSSTSQGDLSGTNPTVGYNAPEKEQPRAVRTGLVINNGAVS